MKIRYLLFSLLFAIPLHAQEDTKEIEGVTIKSGMSKYKNRRENPAYAIMQEVWRRKRSNGLAQYDTYRYKEYEKIEIDAANLDSAFTKKRLFRNMDFIFDYADSTASGKLVLPLFINESIYKTTGENRPQQRRKRLLIAQKNSGFEGNQVITKTAQNLYRDINIYDNTLNFFDIGFPSPVSSDGFSTYDYELMEETVRNGAEVYRIKFQPKRADVQAFAGVLYISKESYAVVQANLRSTKQLNVNFVNSIALQLSYDNPDEHTFLPLQVYTELQLSILSKSKEAQSMLAKRTLNISDYELNVPLNNADFETRKEELEPDFASRDEEFWINSRTEELTNQERAIYEMHEKLKQNPKFQRVVKAYETLESGYVNFGNKIDIGNLYSIYGRNAVEGDRIRLDARTYFSQNDMWRVQGYLAYGFRDGNFKYGGEAKYMFNKVNRLTLGVAGRKDIVQMGVQLTGDEGIMSRTFASSSVFSRGENASLSEVGQGNIFTSIEPWKNIQLRLDGTLQSIRSANPEGFNLEYFRQGELRKTVNDSHLSFSVIARPGALYSKSGVERSEHSTLAATIVARYSRGIEGLFNADFNYDKLQLLLYKPFLTGSWGRMELSLEGGKNFQTLPLALQNVIPGNQSYSVVQNTFAQLNYYEFVAEQYATLHLEHHFNGKLFSFLPILQKLKLREILMFRSAVGSLSDEAKSINVDGWRYSAPAEHPYYEYGFGIENIGVGNLRLFRLDFNWRGNYLENPGAKRFGVKFGYRFYF
ncbi:DUF5686 family protein [Cruoricaptor ignavus]|uniref:DUF5686 family protein n=1 Tax=Cruoricaptor ignavus TaxID=1118202 RepID=UPI00370D8A81